MTSSPQPCKCRPPTQKLDRQEIAKTYLCTFQTHCQWQGQRYLLRQPWLQVIERLLVFYDGYNQAACWGRQCGSPPTPRLNESVERSVVYWVPTLRRKGANDVLRTNSLRNITDRPSLPLLLCSPLYLRLPPCLFLAFQARSAIFQTQSMFTQLP